MEVEPALVARKAEIDARHELIGELLAGAGAEQLLVLEPPNVAWFCGAPLARGILDPADQPALVINANSRWLLCSNTDSRRLFDTYLDGLGFQLKEWPWYQPREQLFAEVCQNRAVACDRLVRDARPVADRLKALRLPLSPEARTSMRRLGADLAHALEATGRNVDRGATEQQVAGHFGHRLIHRGAEPVVVHVAADGRSAVDARPAYANRRVESWCLLSATARRDGLHATASRTVWFEAPGADFREEFDAAASLVAARSAALTAGTTAQAVYAAGQRVAEPLGRENLWRESSFGHWTGWLPVEQALVPGSGQVFNAGNSVVSLASVGRAAVAETFLVTDAAAEWLTPSDAEWPRRRFKIGEKLVDLPDLLAR